MKGISVRIRKVTLHTDNGYYGVKWLHPTAVLPEQIDKYCKTYVTCDEMVNGVVVSEPFIHEDNACVVVQLQTEGRFESFETFWIGHLG